MKKIYISIVLIIIVAILSEVFSNDNTTNKKIDNPIETIVKTKVTTNNPTNNPTEIKTNNPTNTPSNNPINNDPTIKPKNKSKFDGTFTNETKSAYIIIKGNKSCIVNDLKEEKFWEVCEVIETETSKEMKYIYPDGSGEYTLQIIDNRLKEISKDYNFGDVNESFWVKIK